MTTPTEIPGVIYSPIQAHRDERGRFTEIMRASSYPTTFVQSNHSRSSADVLRGMHYHQHQADLWYVVSGRAQVALVDLRQRDTDPAVAMLTMRGEEPSGLYIPEGVAHGFLALAEVDLIYFVTDYYDAGDEYGLAWDDPTLAIPWAKREFKLSARDSSNPVFSWTTIPTF